MEADGARILQVVRNPSWQLPYVSCVMMFVGLLIQFGINDAAVDVWRTPPATGPRVALAEYKRNLECLVGEFEKRRIGVILMTPNPLRWSDETRRLYGRPPYHPSDLDGFNVLLKDYAAAARDVARTSGVQLVDVYGEYETYARAHAFVQWPLGRFTPSPLRLLPFAPLRVP